MLPPGMDPRKMQQLMRQMGINSRPIEARRVVIEAEEGNYIIKEPQVTEVVMQGQKSFQVSGEVVLEAAISREDAELVASQAGCSLEDAERALKESGGDIAQAILSLKGKQ